MPRYFIHFSLFVILFLFSLQDDQVIRNLIVTLEKHGFQNGENIKNNPNATTGFIFRNHSNVHLHVKYINTSGHVSHEERSFTFPEASFNLSSSALPLNSSAIVVVMWYKTLHSFLTNILHDNEEINSKIITASVRPEPREKFSQPVRISWNIKKLVSPLLLTFESELKIMSEYSRYEQSIS